MWNNLHGILVYHPAGSTQELCQPLSFLHWEKFLGQHNPELERGPQTLYCYHHASSTRCIAHWWAGWRYMGNFLLERLCPIKQPNIYHSIYNNNPIHSHTLIWNIFWIPWNQKRKILLHYTEYLHLEVVALCRGFLLWESIVQLHVQNGRVRWCQTLGLHHGKPKSHRWVSSVKPMTQLLD